MEKQRKNIGKLRRWTGNAFSYMFSPRKVFSVDSHIENWRWIKGMAKAVLLPKKKLTVQEMKAIAKLPRNQESYQAAVEKYGASLEKQHQLWKGHVIQAYIFMFAFFLNAMYAAYDSSIFHTISSIGIGLFFFARWMKGALLAYQIQNQQLDGIGEFFSSPLEWIPNTVWSPAIVVPVKPRIPRNVVSLRSSK